MVFILFSGSYSNSCLILYQLLMLILIVDLLWILSDFIIGILKITGGISHKITSLSSLLSCLKMSLRLSKDALSLIGMYQLNNYMLFALRGVISK